MKIISKYSVFCSTIFKEGTIITTRSEEEDLANNLLHTGQFINLIFFASILHDIFAPSPWRDMHMYNRKPHDDHNCDACKYLFASYL